MACYRMEPSITFAELEMLAEIERIQEFERLTEPERLAEVERLAELQTLVEHQTAELDDGPAEIGHREKTGHSDKAILLEQIKTHGMICVVSNSPKTMDQIINSVECLNAQIEYLHSKRRKS